MSKRSTIVSILLAGIVDPVSSQMELCYHLYCFFRLLRGNARSHSSVGKEVDYYSISLCAESCPVGTRGSFPGG
jgi:hypothetical protein